VVKIKSLKWISSDRLYARISISSQQRQKIRNFRDQGSSEWNTVVCSHPDGSTSHPNTIYFPITSDIKHTQNHSDASVWRGTSLSLFSLDPSNGTMKITFSFFDKITIRICSAGSPTRMRITTCLTYFLMWAPPHPARSIHGVSRKFSILLQ
jgi:hypothetical protein